MKVEDKKFETISAVELNEYISQFIISVRTKDGTEYEPPWLPSLTAASSETENRSTQPHFNWKFQMWLPKHGFCAPTSITINN